MPPPRWATALEQRIIPERYQRNIGTVGIDGQMRLLRSKVGVVGAGGLGGLAIELLARMGIGSLVVIDSDSFTASNLNRQLLSLEGGLGAGKAETAARRVKEINGAVEILPLQQQADASNSRFLAAATWPRCSTTSPPAALEKPAAVCIPGPRRHRRLHGPTGGH